MNEQAKAQTDKDYEETAAAVAMRDEELTEVLMGDRHFEQAGFKALWK